MEEVSLFKQLLGYIVKIVAIIHTYIMSLNDKFELFLSDKMLHFIVVAALGMFLLLIVYPLFKWLIDENKLILVAWIYVFTILIAITLLIEIGQDYSGTGDMDFADIVSGLLGFIVVSAGYIFVRHFIKKNKTEIKKEETKDEQEQGN